MPDYTLANTDQGIYEIPLAADVAITIGAANPAYLTLLVHSGESPVYVRGAVTVTVKAGAATMAVAGMWVDVPGSFDVWTITSASEAIVSVFRT